MSDVSRGLEFYLGRLGFCEFFRLGDPPNYAIVERDAVSPHLMPACQEARGLGRSSIYVFATAVDALHEQLRAPGCGIERAPANFDYGMREMSLRIVPDIASCRNARICASASLVASGSYSMKWPR